MAIALGTVAIGGVFLGIRTTFGPADGPARLIFAFEAVIIGGLGSLWGTLVGGIVLGVAQALGNQISPAFQLLAGHLVFLAILLFRPRGPVRPGRTRARHDRARRAAFRVAQTTTARAGSRPSPGWSCSSSWPACRPGATAGR